MKKKRDLKSFAKSLPKVRGRICWVCTIPERRELDAARIESEEARARGFNDEVTTSDMARWLREECGYEQATRPKLHNHFQRGHHREKEATAR